MSKEFVIKYRFFELNNLSKTWPLDTILIIYEYEYF